MDQSPINKHIIDHYDGILDRPEFFEFYGASHFMNFGYWDKLTSDQKTACENLIEKLLSFIPEKSGTILDVACGKGATTEYLLKYYCPENVIGTNISLRQLQNARTIAPGCTFLLMDAVYMGFQDGSIDNIVCVEAAFHFCSREKFLEEAYRVLKPGGLLVFSDILMTREAERTREMRTEKNYVNNLEEYENLLFQAGFSEVKVIDATEACWKGHFWYTVHYVHQRYLSREISYADLLRNLSKTYRRVPDLRYYLLAAARKS